MKRMKILLKTIYPALLIATGVSGCMRDPVDTPPLVVQQGKTVTVELAVPGYEIQETRAMADGKNGDAAVKTIDLLVFDNATNPNLLRVYNTAANIRQSTDPPYYKVSFDVELEELEDAGTLVVVANATDAVDHAINGEQPPSDPPRTTKSTIMSYMRHYLDADSDGRYQWNASADNFMPIPMYGEIKVPDGGITGGMKLTGIELTRMLARIDIQNDVDGSIFQLQDIYIVNYHGGGVVPPKWVPATGVLIQPGDPGYIYETNTDPSLPNTAPTPGIATKANSLHYSYPQEPDAPGDLMSGEIFTFEEVKGLESDPAGRIGMILFGKYMGEDYYYKVDFRCSGDVVQNGVTYAKKGDLMPLFRNHKYIITITDAEGVGYRTFEEALAANGVLSNLKTWIHVVDMSDIKNIVYNGQYYMGVAERHYNVYWSQTGQVTLPVNSNYPGAWTASVLNGPAAGITLNASGGPAITDKVFNLDLTMAAVPSPATCRIVFTAGRLRDTITISRYTMSSVFARSNVVAQTEGTTVKLTFATTEEDNRTTIPAWSEGVLFKWGALTALAPPNSFQPPLTIIFNPAGLDLNSMPDSLEGWDQIPYAHPHYGFNFLPSGNEFDAFRWFNNDTGFNENSGVGDVCRYISSKGWVEGKWRMPTYAELRMLYNETGVEVSNGDFSNKVDDLNNPSFDYSYGGFNPVSGWFLGKGVTASTGNPQVPPEGTMFMPASGFRYPNGHGNIVQVGGYGYYWSSTPYTEYSVNYLFLSKYGVGDNDADRSYAFPVRCITDF